MKKQSFLKGSVILIASAIIAKAIGALFKIPLTNMLGGVGMSYFSCAYGLFLPVYALTATGLTTAVAKLTAESCAFGNYRNVKKIQKVSLLLFSAAGLAGTVAVAILAGPFSEKIAACPKAELSILMIAPSVFFGCLTAVYRGCWEGMRNMYPTAVSQVIEALVRLAAGLALCSYVLTNPDKVLTHFPEGTDILAVAAAASVLGISLSTLAGTLFLYIRGTGLENNSPEIKSGHEESSKTIIKAIFKILIPVALGSIVTNLTSLIDLATIIRCLDKSIKSAPEYLIGKYGLNDIDPLELSEFIYGSFNGLAVTIFNLIPSITNKLSCKTDTSLSFSQPCTGMFSFRRKSDISWGRSNFSCPFISSVQLSSGNRQSGRSRQAHAYRSSGKACRKSFINTNSGNKRIRCGDIDVALLFCNICFINFGLLKSRRS